MKPKQKRIFKKDTKEASLFFRDTTILNSDADLKPLRSDNPFASTNPLTNSEVKQNDN